MSDHSLGAFDQLAHDAAHATRVCNLNNMARLVSLAADELLLNRHGDTDPNFIRMAPADQAMLLYGIGQLETMSAALREALV